jgi:hypothetical protein
MRWTTVRQLVSELGLKADPTDIRAVEQELQGLRLELHPDRNGGTFEDAAHEARYYAVDEALRFVQSSGHALVAIEQLAPALALLRELQGFSTGSRVAPAPTHDEIIQAASRRLHRHYALPRITSATLAAIFTVLIGWNSTVEESPLMRPMALIALGSVDYEIYSDTESLEARLRIGIRSGDAESSPDNWRGHRLVFEAKSVANLLTARANDLRPSQTQTTSNVEVATPGEVTLRNAASQLELFADAYDRALNIRERLQSQLTLLLTLAIAITACWFVVVWLREASDVRWLEFLGTEQGVRAIFQKLTETAAFSGRDAFHRSDVDRAVSEKAIPLIAQGLLGRFLPIQHVEPMSGMILEKLIARKVIAVNLNPSVDVEYRLVVARPSTASAV